MLLDLLNNRQALLGLSLLDQARPQARRQSFGGGVLAALGNIRQFDDDQARKAAEAEDRARRKQQFDMQQQQGSLTLQQLQQQMAQQQRLNDWRDSIPEPQGVPLPAGPYIGAARDSQAANMPQPTAVPPQQQALYGALKAGAINPLQYHQALQKDNTPIKLAAGETLLDPTTLKPMFTAPDKQNDPGDWKLYQLSGAPQRGISFDEWDLQRRRAGASNTTVSLSQPTPVTLPDGSTVLAQFPNKPGAPMQIARMPGTGEPLRPQTSDKTKEAVRENAAALAKVDRAIASLEQYPAALGGQNYFDVGGAVMQRVDPKGIEVRAQVADLGSAKIHDRSGAAVTAAEFPRLRPFVPQATDTPEAASKKLKLFRQELQFIQQELNSGATLQQASMPRGSVGLTMPSQSAIAAEIARRQQGGR